MNARAFARRIIKDPAYRQSVVMRANAGTLSPDLESLLWEIADTRVSFNVNTLAPVQSATLHVIRPPDSNRHSQTKGK